MDDSSATVEQGGAHLPRIVVTAPEMRYLAFLAALRIQSAFEAQFGYLAGRQLLSRCGSGRHALCDRLNRFVVEVNRLH